MDGNKIGDECAITIAEAIQSNTSIWEFNLVQNAISKKGGIAIASSLTINKSITELDLQQELSDDGFWW